MLARKTFWTLTLAVAVVGIAGGAVVGDSLIHREVAQSDAAWAQVFRTPDQLTRGVDAVVFAHAVTVEAGRVAYSDNGEDALPYQVYEFEVIRPVKGLKGADRIFVERAGGESAEGAVYLDADGGEFEIGQAYMLFLNQQPDGPYFYQVNHQGRYRVANGRLHASVHDDVVTEALNGRTIEEGLRIVKGTQPTGQIRK
jgi:hypothetical protein